jgi:hypothetical protein
VTDPDELPADTTPLSVAGLLGIVRTWAVWAAKVGFLIGVLGMCIIPLPYEPLLVQAITKGVLGSVAGVCVGAIVGAAFGLANNRTRLQTRAVACQVAGISVAGICALYLAWFALCSG